MITPICLFAVESGSRSWGFASDDSDYDVRCVHVRPMHEYLGIHTPGEQIEVVIDVGKDKLEIISWDIADGICTDYPTALKSIL